MARTISKKALNIELEQRKAFLTYENDRDRKVRLMTCLMQNFDGYREEVNNRRKYYFKHHKDEYKSYLYAIKSIKKTFEDKSSTNVNFTSEPFKFVL